MDWKDGSAAAGIGGLTWRIASMFNRRHDAKLERIAEVAARKAVKEELDPIRVDIRQLRDEISETPQKVVDLINSVNGG